MLNNNTMVVRRSTWYFRCDGAAASSDKDVRGGVAHPVHLNLTVSRELRMPNDTLHFRLNERKIKESCTVTSWASNDFHVITSHVLLGCLICILISIKTNQRNTTV